MKRSLSVLAVGVLAASCAKREAASSNVELSLSTGASQRLDLRYKVESFRNDNPQVLWNIESLGLEKGACRGLFGGIANPERDDQVVPFGMEITGEVNVIYVGNRTLSRINQKRASTREPYWCRLALNEFQKLLNSSVQKEKNLALKNHSCLLPKSHCYAGTLDPDIYEIPDELKSVTSARRTRPRGMSECPAPDIHDEYGQCTDLGKNERILMVRYGAACPAGFYDKESTEGRLTDYCVMVDTIDRKQ